MEQIQVNYKNPKKYNTSKHPIRQPIIIVWLIWILSKILLMGKKYKVEKINMEGVKPPFIMLSNHQYFIDFELAAMATFPYRVNNVVNIDGYYRRPWLMELIGSICKRKFTKDLHLVRSVSKVLKKGDIVSIYPEARYTPIGILAYLPESLGKLVKLNKVPLVVVKHRGNHLHTPFWNFRKPRKVPMHTTMTQVLTKEQVEAMSVDEINKAIHDAMDYDEYVYQKENNILIKEPYRAEGLHKVLYQCPHCMAESQMGSEGAQLYCKVCGKRWTLLENGDLQAQEGETEFAHIPDWFEWERTQVRKQIEEGTYFFQDKVDVYSLPRCWRFEHLGEATLTHDPNLGFIIEGFYNRQPYRVVRKIEEQNSLHVEYDYCYIKPFDCVDISTEQDSFYCYPMTQTDVITKMAFAVEELFQRKQREIKETKKIKA